MTQKMEEAQRQRRETHCRKHSDNTTKYADKNRQKKAPSQNKGYRRDKDKQTKKRK